MKTDSSKSRKKTSSAKIVKKRSDSAETALAICPVDGAGWCPYPFSPAQLRRRLKKKQEEEQQNKPLVSSNK
jgi:hypothetical protein